MLRQRLFSGALIALVFSLGVHGGVALILYRLPNVSAAAHPTAAYEVDLDPIGAVGAIGAPSRGNAPHAHDRAIPGGSESAQNIDADDRGEGGDTTGARQGILLMHVDQGIVLFDSPLNNVAAMQTQRIRTARDRATVEHRRATPNPRDDAHLAVGPGEHRERRPVNERDAAEGARVAPVASVRGGAPSIDLAAGADGEGAEGERTSSANRRASVAANDSPGTENESPGVGILSGEGQRRSQAARVADIRPPVDRGPAAAQAERTEARIRDEDDAEHLAASMTQSWVESTTRTARRAGDGRGGVGGGGDPGSGGGRREGGRASTFGPGDGRYDALDTSDQRYRTWFLVLRRRVYDALEFPQERELALDQGTTVYSIVVRRDGTLAEAPRRVRSSGFPDLDEAARVAIMTASPFPPIPPDLAPNMDRVRISAFPIAFENSMMP
jgi:TonB family protein